MNEFGLDSQIVDDAFTFEIKEEVKGGKIKLVRVRDSLLKADDMLFALPDVLDEEKGPYADFLNHVSQIKVTMLNELIEFAEPYTQEEMEEVLLKKQNNDFFLESEEVILVTNLFLSLSFVPDGFAIDSDLEGDDKEEKEEEDYSDLDAELVEVPIRREIIT